MESRNSTSVLTLWFWARALGILAVLVSGGIWLESRAAILLSGPKTERDTATAPPSATPFLDRAASIVTAEAESWGKESGLAPEYLYALSAMNHVQTNLSPGNYDGLAKSGQIPRLMTAEMCLQSGAGLCGSHVDAFERILDRCKIPVKRRTVEFYLPR